MPKFFITTLGCKVNRYESDAIAETLQRAGWHGAAGPEEAALCIVNTCAVTQKAAMQSRQAIRRALKENPGARILVTGCYAQTEPEALKKIGGIECLVNQSAKYAIADMLAQHPEHGISAAQPEALGLSESSLFMEPALPVVGSRTRPVLKIQDGCDAFCSYCIVPYARGRSRSMPIENVLENIRRLAGAGFHEVVLCGIHLGCYGLDLAPPASLLEVLKRAEAASAIERLRLSSIEPAELSHDIIRLASASERICHHFHIPLQSGDDAVLKRMRRPYSRSFFRELIFAVDAAMPDASVGVDVLVGFPGETEEAFENTFELIAELPISYLHVFPFSSRKGTPAARFPDKISPEAVKARCRTMRRLGNEKRRRFYSRFVGKTLPVLIESRRDPTGGLRGFSPNYLSICLSGGDDLKNTIARVRIESLGKDNVLHGSLCR